MSRSLFFSAFFAALFPFSLQAGTTGISPHIDVATPLPSAEISGISPAEDSFDSTKYDAQFGYQVPNGPLRFNLALSEFERLRAAAKMAGGDVEITVKPVGFKMANYIVPLQRVGFDVRVATDGDVVVSSAKDFEDLELRKSALQKEVNALRETRRRLISDINSLQTCTNTNLASYFSTFADNQNQQPYPPPKSHP